MKQKKSLPLEVQKKEDGRISVHAGVNETSLMLFLNPDVVDPAYTSARILVKIFYFRSNSVFGAAHDGVGLGLPQILLRLRASWRNGG